MSMLCLTCIPTHPLQSQFVRLAQAALHLQPVSADALEQAVDLPAENNNLLSDLCARLLHSDPDAPVSEKEVDSWELSVQRKLNKQWLDSFPANPMAGRSFGDLTPMLRVRRGLHKSDSGFRACWS